MISAMLWYRSIFVNKNSKPGNASVYFLARVPQFCRLFDNKYDLMVIYLGYMDPQLRRRKTIRNYTHA